MITRVTRALRTWAAQVSVSQHEVDRVVGWLRVRMLAPVSLLDITVEACVFRCAVVCVIARNKPMLAKDLSHQLGLVTRALADWMFAEKSKARGKPACSLVASACCCPLVGKLQVVAVRRSGPSALQCSKPQAVVKWSMLPGEH